jgi:hypothetical protein
MPVPGFDVPGNYYEPDCEEPEDERPKEQSMTDVLACDHPNCECDYDCERNDKHDEWLKENPYICAGCGEKIDTITQNSTTEVMTGKRYHDSCYETRNRK